MHTGPGDLSHFSLFTALSTASSLTVIDRLAKRTLSSLSSSQDPSLFFLRVYSYHEVMKASGEEPAVIQL